MLKRLFLLAVLCLVVSRGAFAADAGFTPVQRQQIIQIIRDALKTDPSILRDAVMSLQADDQAKDEADMRARLAEKHQVLTADAADAVAGNPAGDVTVVEFYDPRCPYCRKMLPALHDLLEKDHGIRLVYKDIPVLGPASTMESRAIVAAQSQGGYFKMQSALMSNPAQPTDDMIRDTAKGLGLNPAKLAADMNGPAVVKRIEANLLLAHELKVQGTPVFMVGNTVIPGAVDVPALETAVAAARKHS